MRNRFGPKRFWPKPVCFETAVKLVSKLASKVKYETIPNEKKFQKRVPPDGLVGGIAKRIEYLLFEENLGALSVCPVLVCSGVTGGRGSSTF